MKIGMIGAGPPGTACLQRLIGAARVVICMSTCDPDRLAALAARTGGRGVRLPTRGDTPAQIVTAVRRDRVHSTAPCAGFTGMPPSRTQR